MDGEHLETRNKLAAVGYADFIKLLVDKNGRTILQAALEHNRDDIVNFVNTKIGEKENGYVEMKDYIDSAKKASNVKNGNKATAVLEAFIKENVNK